MAVVKIIAYDVIPGKEHEAELKFRDQRGMLASLPGLINVDLLRPVAGESRYLLYTRWDTEESASAWLAAFLPHAPDGSGPIKKALIAGQLVDTPPLSRGAANRRRQHRLRSSTASAFAVLEFDIVEEC